MPYLKVTLMRSAIGLPKKTNLVLASLGLRKRMQSVFHTVSPQTAGMVLKVKELVHVEQVNERKTIQELRQERRPSPGFIVEGNLLKR
ncbi:putative 50S ribosomal protein L30 [Taphrina deformans PYCC 5710]|uniref:Large ribosomal subunit protein uL30m n=1 Tax=Taphrina deformans (strain PYCC 5710 / ATCC 11124 / CBS 356.35 / IMI 108563 / JCM 9778 / NBRC 8474) TaxID=1097556 RepID=R4X7E3_TAPDE|nr:putative 50S ribosomal protein L30 [Taphrina deformans PYCC 5710]|eukprot:CCG81256.1 putative 50S ribosomal protein L30 [Taphrina deformans PYCC 5710]